MLKLYYLISVTSLDKLVKNYVIQLVKNYFLKLVKNIIHSGLIFLFLCLKDLKNTYYIMCINITSKYTLYLFSFLILSLIPILFFNSTFFISLDFFILGLILMYLSIMLLLYISCVNLDLRKNHPVIF